MSVLRFLVLTAFLLQFCNGFPAASNLVINFFGTPNKIKLSTQTIAPIGYVSFENSYYKYHRGPQLWSKARQICEAEGGHLAIINSEQERNFLRGLMDNYPSSVLNDVVHKDYILLGFHDYFKEGEYVTIDGKSIESSGFMHWAPGQPDNAGGNEDCGSLHRSGGLNDFPCATASPFICEISEIPSEICVSDPGQTKVDPTDEAIQQTFLPKFDLRSSVDH